MDCVNCDYYKEHNIEHDGVFYECPVCGNAEIEQGQNYCQMCGEALEWEGEEN